MLDVVLTGLAISSGFALAAAGITMIYMSTETFNFAHASMVSYAFYVVFIMNLIYGGSPYLYIPLAAIVSGIIGVIIYFTINRWLIRAGATMVVLMMSTLGADLILFGILNSIAEYLTETFKRDARYFLLAEKDIVVGRIGETNIMLIHIVSLIVVLIVVSAIHLFLTKTKFGIAMRTTVENPTLAKVLGINPETVYIASWFIGGALAGLGGGLLTLIIPGEPRIGMVIIVPLFAASIVGGLYSIFGSLLGGFLIGLSQQIGIYLLAQAFGSWINAYKLIIPLAMMVITLLIYPQGLGALPWGKLASKLGRRGGEESGV